MKRPAIIQRVLVFDLNHLGDLLMSSPVYRLFNEYGISADAVGYPFAKEIFEANPFVHRYYLGKGIGLVWQAIKARFRKYDVVLQLNTSFKVNLLLLIAGKHRLGYDYKGKGFTNTIRVPIDTPTFQTKYRVDECLELIEKGLGFGGDVRGRPSFSMIFSINNLGWFLGQGKFVGLHTCPRHHRHQRTWPYFPELANEIYKKYGATIVLTGSTEDRDYVDSLAGWITPHINLCGRISIQRLAATLTRFEFFVAINSFPMHLAIARNVPTVAIIGRTPAKIIIPPDNKLVRYLEDPAIQGKELKETDISKMNEITVDDVMEQIGKLMEVK